MNMNAFSVFTLFLISSFVALVLMLLPLPQWLFYFWPDWIALVIFYWALAVPNRINALAGFFMGLAMEVLLLRNFGVFGFGYAILAFVVNRSHQQLRMLSLWQQMIIVGLLLALVKLITGWLYGMVSDFVITMSYLYSIVGNMLVWPFVFILLSELQRSGRNR